MRKLWGVSLLAVSMCMTVLCSCGKANETVQEAKVSEETEKIVQTKEETSTLETGTVDRTQAFAFFDQISIGWNLGNSFDAYGQKDGTKDETAWGNPATTKEMIDAVAAQGFHTIRIPVTWSDHLGAAPEYKIDEEWMNRVKEVVQYAIDDDLYVIINTHHEPDFWLIPTAENQEQLKVELSAIWKQIAEAFAEYDEKLIFEGMNEPRVKGSAAEWIGGTPAERGVINALNQVFVDTVRATGGNNTERYLIICSYGNCADRSGIQELEIPNDANIAVAIHMYTPYDFTYEASPNSITIWDGSRKRDIASAVKTVNDILIKDGEGIPVIITEFGAQNKNNTEEVIKWLDDYLDIMNEYGIRCIWWDNNAFTDGEKFGIFDRSTCTFTESEIADELIKKTTKGE